MPRRPSRLWKNRTGFYGVHDKGCLLNRRQPEGFLFTTSYVFGPIAADLLDSAFSRTQDSSTIPTAQRPGPPHTGSIDLIIKLLRTRSDISDDCRGKATDSWLGTSSSAPSTFAPIGASVDQAGAAEGGRDSVKRCGPNNSPNQKAVWRR